MEYVRIKSTNDQQFEELIALYLESFPRNERREVSDFKELLDTNQSFRCYVVLVNDAFVGFFNFWEFEDFVYLEHIAISPNLRGHKLGEKVILYLKSSIDKPIVLEAETAESSDFGARRINFYKRLGFDLLPVKYYQPPYRKGEEYVYLEIMSDDLTFAKTNFEKIKDTIYKEVYQV